MKTLVYIVGGLIILVTGFFLFNSYIYTEKQGEQFSGSITASGTVLAVDLSGIAADGPALLTLQTADGAVYSVGVPSMGLPLCPAKANIADVYTLQRGAKVSVHGTRAEDGTIVPCESPDHYLRVEGGTPAAQTKTVTLKLGETGDGLGSTITPMKLLEDSRCPADVQCIQAGTVRVDVQLVGGMGTATQAFTLGQPITTEVEEITLADVIPLTEAGHKVPDSEYIFSFHVKPPNSGR